MEEQRLFRKKKKAEREGNKTLLATACIDLGTYYFRTGKYESAIEEFLVVAKLYKETGQKMEYGSAHRMIGQAYTEIREFDKALEHQGIHLSTAKEEKNELEEQRALANMGHIYLTKYLVQTKNGDKTPLRLAYNALTKSLQVCERLTNIEKKEHLDMSARLLANLGIIQEYRMDYEKALDLLQKSIKICKENDLFEQLERSYKILGSIYTKKKEYGSAIDSLSLAINIADRLPNKAELKCGALASMAEVLLQMGDFRSAKSKLRKAYNMKISNVTERENLKLDLKTVAAMCYAEDSLITTPTNDHVKRKKLYEKLGDGASILKQFPLGIEYYQKMLQEAEKAGETGKELSPCYVSLAMTYKDNKEYDDALQYLYKDLDTSVDNIEENITTLYTIAEVMTQARMDTEEINSIYHQIMEKSRLINAPNLEKRVSKSYSKFLKTIGRNQEAEELERKFDFTSSDDEDNDPTNNVASIGDDIDTDDITDTSDSDEQEKESKPIRRLQKMKPKRNKKGETELHTACIKGDVSLVRKLLEQGHPVNERDFCGWLPIHEACISGHLEVVKVLIAHQADINDRGGKGCLGVTPLHDACTNGHLEIVEYLLDKGASVVAKTDNRETPLNFLKQWYETAKPLSEEMELSYTRIMKRMKSALERFGETVEEKPSISTAAYENNENTPRKRWRRSPRAFTPSPSPKKTQTSPKKVPKTPKMRKRLCDSTTDEEDDNSLEVHAKNEYIQVMENLRNRTAVPEKKRKSGESNKTAHVEYDDWLEDDLGVNVKKRKSCGQVPADLLYSSNARSPVNKTKEGTVDSDAESRGSGASEDGEAFSNDTGVKPASRRKKQISLIKAGFSRSKTTKPDLLRAEREVQSSVTSAVPSRSVVMPEVQQPSMFAVDVRIEEKLYRVPIPSSEVNVHTIRWLADEASKRYFKREGIKPDLELETKNGAILADEDLVSMLFPLGSTQAEELKATITKRSIPLLVERYEEACIQMNKNSNEELKTLLRHASTVLDLTNFEFRSATLLPLYKAINRQSNLVELTLSGNLMDDECFLMLCTSLQSLTNLTTLNLSLNHLTAQSLKAFSNTFTNSNQPVLEYLINLNLSYNPISNEGFHHLGVITRYLKLKVLNLANVSFTHDIFENPNNRNVELSLGNIESLDISHNELSKTEIIKFISWLNPQVIEDLNLSGNHVTQGRLLKEIIENRGDADLVLRNVGFSNCSVTDLEIYELLRIPTLSTVDLSHNKHLTSLSLRRLLLRRPPLKYLNICECENIFKYFNVSDWHLTETSSLTSVTMSARCEQDEEAIDALKKLYINKACKQTGKLFTFV